MKTIKTSKLIQQEAIALSITVSPIITGGFEVKYFLKEKTKLGATKTKTIKIDEVIEDVEFPILYHINYNYNIYKHYKSKTSNFYINLYRM